MKWNKGIQLYQCDDCFGIFTETGIYDRRYFYSPNAHKQHLCRECFKKAENEERQHREDFFE